MQKIDENKTPWQIGFGINIIQSNRAYEICKKQSTGVSILHNFDKTPEGFNVVCHKTFAFFLSENPFQDRFSIKKCFENIEKLYLLHKLKVKPYRSHLKVSKIDITRLIKPEGQTANIVSIELLEDIAALDIDLQLSREIENKEIYYFKRVGWVFETRETWDDNDIVFNARSRFEFLIYDKAKEEATIEE